MQPLQSPQSTKVARYDTMTGQPLPHLYDPYTGERLSNQPSISPIREPTYPNQHNIPPPSYHQPSYPPPPYQPPGISDEISTLTRDVVGHFLVPPMGAPISIDVNQPVVGPLQCQYCRRTTGQTVRRKIGGTAIGWGVCLWFWTGLLCWLPCVMEGCKDAELICATCGHVKNIIHAPCCC